MEDNKDNLISINESDVPKLIEDQFNIMNNLKQHLDLAKSKSCDAEALAKNAKDKKVGFFNKKETIEGIINTQMSLSEATLSNTLVLEKTFEYQQALTNITKYLFGLGVSNIAVNRSIVRELELRLNDASSDELDEFARRELVNVVKDLKSQEDLIKKQTDFSSKLRDVNVMVLNNEALLNKYKEQCDKLNNDVFCLNKNIDRSNKLIKILTIGVFISLILIIILFIIIFRTKVKN